MKRIRILKSGLSVGNRHLKKGEEVDVEEIGMGAAVARSLVASGAVEEVKAGTDVAPVEKAEG